MEAIINITDHNGQSVASARELHTFLEVETRFDMWIKRMLDYGFSENSDFQRLHKIVQTPNGGQKEVLADYALTLDTAKEISMLQRSEKGKQARQYFIDCERKMRNPLENVSKLDIAKMLVESEERKLMLEQENERKSKEIEYHVKTIQQQAPTVQYATTVLDSLDLIATNVIAKEMGMSAISFNKMLNERKIIYKQNSVWLLYSQYQNKGYTKTKTHTYFDSSGQSHAQIQTYWTQKGRKFLHSMFNPNFVNAQTQIQGFQPGK